LNNIKLFMNNSYFLKRKKFYIFLFVVLAFFMLCLLKNAHVKGLLADGLVLCGAQSAQLADTELTEEQWREITGNGDLLMTERAELEPLSDVQKLVLTLPSGEKRMLEIGIWHDEPVLLVGRQAYVCEHGDAQPIRTPQT